MPATDFIVIAVFPSLEEAHMARNFLLNHDIASHLIEARGYGDHVHKPDVHLLVAPECAARAREVLPKKSRLIEPRELLKPVADSAAIASPDPQPEFDRIPGPSLGTMLLGLVVVVVLVAAWFVYFFVL